MAPSDEILPINFIPNVHENLSFSLIICRSLRVRHSNHVGTWHHTSTLHLGVLQTPIAAIEVY
eukprot:scaffold13825_cov174-Amphora_coffeaeformis.AAC.5